MARATLGPLVNDLRGSVGEVIFDNWMGISIVRSKPKYIKNPSTKRQAAIRGLFNALTQKWRTFTPDQKEAWNAAARARAEAGGGVTPSSEQLRKPQREIETGFNYMIEVNLIKKLADPSAEIPGFDQITLPPSGSSAPPTPVWEEKDTEEAFQLSFYAGLRMLGLDDATARIISGWKGATPPTIPKPGVATQRMIDLLKTFTPAQLKVWFLKQMGDRPLPVGGRKALMEALQALWNKLHPNGVGPKPAPRKPRAHKGPKKFSWFEYPDGTPLYAGLRDAGFDEFNPEDCCTLRLWIRAKPSHAVVMDSFTMGTQADGTYTPYDTPIGFYVDSFPVSGGELPISEGMHIELQMDIITAQGKKGPLGNRKVVQPTNDPEDPTAEPEKATLPEWTTRIL